MCSNIHHWCASHTDPCHPCLATPNPNPQRLKSSLERVRRLTESFTETLLDLFPTVAQRMGHALGVEEYVVNVFTESEVRASTVFQLSRLCSALLKATRVMSGASVWDTLVAGTAGEGEGWA